MTGRTNGAGQAGASTRLRRGVAGTIALLLTVSGLAATTARAASTVSKVTAQPTATSGAVARWTPAPDANRYAVTAYRVTTYGRRTTIKTTSCYACSTAAITGLSQGVTYALGVTPISNIGKATGAEVVSAPMTLSNPQVPNPPVSIQLTASSTDGTLHASWAPAAAGFAPDRWGLLVYQQAANGSWNQVSGGDLDLPITSATIPALPGQWKIIVIAHDAVGWSGPGFSGVVTAPVTCSGADLCVQVGGAAPTSTLAGWGQGFLHGAVAPNGTPVDPTLMQPLAVLGWRVGDAREARAVADTGTRRTTIILSDLWMTETGAGQGGPNSPPWNDLTAYSNWVTAKVQQAKAEGWSPAFWDVFNEPDGVTFSGYLTSSQVGAATPATLLATMETAYRAIRAADPSALIIGASVAKLRLSPGMGTSLDLDTFLRYSEAHGLSWDGIAWHELSGGYEWTLDPARTLDNIDQHVAEVRAALAQHPSVDPSGRLLINEYSSNSDHFLPGASVGYLRTTEDNQVEGERSCWGAECYGMAGPSGLFAASSPGRTGVWWANQALGSMVGQSRVGTSTSSTWQLDALATSDPSTGALRVLLGRHFGCRPDVNPACDVGFAVNPATVRVRVAWPQGTPAHVLATRAPAGAGPVSAPLAMLDQVVTPTNGQLVIDLPALPDGDAVAIAVTQ